MPGLIIIDEHCVEWTAIDTEGWLAAVLGTPLEFESNDNWANEGEILERIAQEIEGGEYECTNRDNVYNNENDFSDQFTWQVFYPKGAEWCWAHDVFVAINVHCGGDVRGNYGSTRLYRTDSLADSGFLEWNLGWSVCYSDNTPVAENERFSIGYASKPFCEMEKHLKGKLHWSKRHQCFVGWYEDGRAIKVHPDLYMS